MSRITLSLLTATALTGLIGFAQAQTLPPPSPPSASIVSPPKPAGASQDAPRAVTGTGGAETVATPAPARPAATASSPTSAPGARRGGAGGPLQLAGDMAGIVEMTPHIVCLGAQDARPPALPTHMEGRLAFLKAELRINDAQTAKWTDFVDAVRAAAKQVQLPCADAARAGTSPSSLERIETAGKLLSARADALKAVASNGRALYASMTDDQKTVADDLMLAPVWQ